MTITWALADSDGGTDMVAVHDGFPNGASAAESGFTSDNPSSVREFAFELDARE
jgi:hypothetical protein